MSESAERQTQPIAVFVSPSVALVTVVASPTSAVGDHYVLSSGVLSLGDSDADVDLAGDPAVSGTLATLSIDDGAVTLRCDANNERVFIRRGGAATVALNDPFLVGNQRLRVVENNDDRPFTWEDGTQLFTSPRRKGTFSVQQLLTGGRIGATASNSDDRVAIGAVDSELVLSHEVSISAAHAVVQRGDDGEIVVIDQGSLNGIYTQAAVNEALESGDLFWVGNQLLRLDITA